MVAGAISEAPSGDGGSTERLELLLNAAWIGFMGLTIYWLFTYSGPYRALCEWQARTWGSYYGAFSLIVLNLPPTLLLLAVRKKLGLGPMPRTLEEIIPLSSENVKVVAVPALILVALVALGAHFYWSGLKAGKLRSVHADDFLSRSVVDTVLYADVRGWPDERIVSTQKGSAIPMYYIPLHGSGGEDEAAPVVIEVQENLVEEYLIPMKDTGEVVVRGLMEQAVPPEVRPIFTEQDVQLAEPCWLVRPAVDPEERKMAGMVAAGLGLALSLFVYVMRRRALSRV